MVYCSHEPNPQLHAGRLGDAERPSRQTRSLHPLRRTLDCGYVAPDPQRRHTYRSHRASWGAVSNWFHDNSRLVGVARRFDFLSPPRKTDVINCLLGCCWQHCRNTDHKHLLLTGSTNHTHRNLPGPLSSCNNHRNHCQPLNSLYPQERTSKTSPNSTTNALTASPSPPTTPKL